MKNNQKKTAILLWAVFIIFQLVFSFYSSNDLLSLMGLMQLFFVTSFLFGYVFCLSIPIKRIYIFFIFYHLLLVGALHQFYLYEYSNPLGFNPRDAAFYHDLALTLKNYSLGEVFHYLKTQQALGDFGYPFILQGIYRISSDHPIIVSNIFNILFHLLTCFYLLKISRYLFKNSKLSKDLLILYGLNPATIFYMASGLKEPLFALLVVLAFYFALKTYHSKSFISTLLAVLFILSTGMFRSAYPVFIVFSLIIYRLWDSEGKYKRVKQLSLLIIGLLGMFGAYLFVEAELTQKMNYDTVANATNRIGYRPSGLDYFVMLIGGLIGPFPSFSFENDNQIRLLQMAGNFIKIFYSYFFIVGAYFAFKNKNHLLYVALLFIIVNISVLVSLAASLDYRFLYPFMPLYFLILAYGYNMYNKKLLPSFIKPSVYIIGVIALVFLYNFR